MVNAGLALVAALFLLAPLVLAALVDQQVRTFQRQAFGHLRKAARNLRVMAWAMFLFYLGVLGGSLAAGDLQQTVEWPLTKEALAIYLRIGAAIGGYVGALFVAKELYLVTRPGKLASGSPDEQA
jgi:hypothetical protein